MKKAQIGILILVVVVLLVIGAYFFFTSDSNKPQNGAISNGEIKEFEVIAKQWSFEPSMIEVNEGDTVILNIKNVDVEHGFLLPEFNINENLAPGENVRVEFVASKKGEFQFFCNVYCGEGHRDMKGILRVS